MSDPATRPYRIGVLSDTHQYGAPRLPEELRTAFAGCDLILHTGDICSSEVLDWLETIAPVRAAQGNWDDDEGKPRMRVSHVFEVAGWRIGMCHDMEPEDRPIADLQRWYLNGEKVDIMITGHTHYERLDYRDGVLQVNSGSATLPHNFSTRLGTVAILDLAPGSIEARILRLGELPGLRNPGVELAFSSSDGVVRRL